MSLAAWDGRIPLLRLGCENCKLHRFIDWKVGDLSFAGQLYVKVPNLEA